MATVVNRVRQPLTSIGNIIVTNQGNKMNRKAKNTASVEKTLSQLKSIVTTSITDQQSLTLALGYISDIEKYILNADTKFKDEKRITSNSKTIPSTTELVDDDNLPADCLMHWDSQPTDAGDVGDKLVPPNALSNHALSTAVVETILRSPNVVPKEEPKKKSTSKFDRGTRRRTLHRGALKLLMSMNDESDDALDNDDTNNEIQFQEDSQKELQKISNEVKQTIIQTLNFEHGSCVVPTLIASDHGIKDDLHSITVPNEITDGIIANVMPSSGGFVLAKKVARAAADNFGVVKRGKGVTAAILSNLSSSSTIATSSSASAGTNSLIPPKRRKLHNKAPFPTSSSISASGGLKSGTITTVAAAPVSVTTMLAPAAAPVSANTSMAPPSEPVCEATLTSFPVAPASVSTTIATHSITDCPDVLAVDVSVTMLAASGAPEKVVNPAEIAPMKEEDKDESKVVLDSLIPAPIKRVRGRKSIAGQKTAPKLKKAAPPHVSSAIASLPETLPESHEPVTDMLVPPLLSSSEDDNCNVGEIGIMCFDADGLHFVSENAGEYVSSDPLAIAAPVVSSAHITSSDGSCSNQLLDTAAAGAAILKDSADDNREAFTYDEAYSEAMCGFDFGLGLDPNESIAYPEGTGVFYGGVDMGLSPLRGDPRSSPRRVGLLRAQQSPFISVPLWSRSSASLHNKSSVSMNDKSSDSGRGALSISSNVSPRKWGGGRGGNKQSPPVTTSPRSTRSPSCRTPVSPRAVVPSDANIAAAVPIPVKINFADSSSVPIDNSSSSSSSSAVCGVDEHSHSLGASQEIGALDKISGESMPQLTAAFGPEEPFSSEAGEEISMPAWMDSSPPAQSKKSKRRGDGGDVPGNKSKKDTTTARPRRQSMRLKGRGDWAGAGGGHEASGEGLDAATAAAAPSVPTGTTAPGSEGGEPSAVAIQTHVEPAVAARGRCRKGAVKRAISTLEPGLEPGCDAEPTVLEPGCDAEFTGLEPGCDAEPFAECELFDVDDMVEAVMMGGADGEEDHDSDNAVDPSAVAEIEAFKVALAQLLTDGSTPTLFIPAQEDVDGANSLLLAAQIIPNSTTECTSTTPTPTKAASCSRSSHSSLLPQLCSKGVHPSAWGTLVSLLALTTEDLSHHVRVHLAQYLSQLLPHLQADHFDEAAPARDALRSKAATFFSSTSGVASAKGGVATSAAIPSGAAVAADTATTTIEQLDPRGRLHFSSIGGEAASLPDDRKPGSWTTAYDCAHRLMSMSSAIHELVRACVSMGVDSDRDYDTAVATASFSSHGYRSHSLLVALIDAANRLRGKDVADQMCACLARTSFQDSLQRSSAPTPTSPKKLIAGKRNKGAVLSDVAAPSTGYVQAASARGLREVASLLYNGLSSSLKRIRLDELMKGQACGSSAIKEYFSQRNISHVTAPLRSCSLRTRAVWLFESVLRSRLRWLLDMPPPSISVGSRTARRMSMETYGAFFARRFEATVEQRTTYEAISSVVSFDSEDNKSEYSPARKINIWFLDEPLDSTLSNMAAQALRQILDLFASHLIYNGSDTIVGTGTDLCGTFNDTWWCLAYLRAVDVFRGQASAAASLEGLDSWITRNMANGSVQLRLQTAQTAVGAELARAFLQSLLGVPRMDEIASCSPMVGPDSSHLPHNHCRAAALIVSGSNSRSGGGVGGGSENCRPSEEVDSVWNLIRSCALNLSCSQPRASPGGSGKAVEDGDILADAAVANGVLHLLPLALDLPTLRAVVDRPWIRPETLQSCRSELLAFMTTSLPVCVSTTSLRRSSGGRSLVAYAEGSAHETLGDLSTAQREDLVLRHNAIVFSFPHITATIATDDAEDP